MESNTLTHPEVTETLYVVDGSGFIFSAYYAVASMFAPDQTPVNAVYGYLRSMIHLIRSKQPHYIALAFDQSGDSFRNEIYPQYKANRSSPPEDFPHQYELCIEGTRQLNIAVLEKEKMEADDVIGTVVTQWLAHTNGRCVIVSKDKDMAQLVNDRVTLWDGKNEELGRDQVITKMGVAPEQVVDLLGLAGDTSDNIPGIPGIGMKTGAKFLQQYNDLESLLAAADSIKGKRGQNLVQFAQQARLSRQLAEIKCDVDLPFELDNLAYQGPDLDQFFTWCEGYNFGSLIKNLKKRPLLKHSINKQMNAQATDSNVLLPLGALNEVKGHSTTEIDPIKNKIKTHSNPPTIKPNPSVIDRSLYRCILTMEQLEDVVQAIQASQILSIDLESTSLKVHQAEIVGVALAWQAGQAAYIPLQHHYLGVPQQLSAHAVWKILQPLLNDEKIIKVGQNIKYDKKLLTLHDITYHNWSGDSMLMAYLLDASRNSFGLDALAKDLLHHQTLGFKEVAGSKGGDDRFTQVDVQRATEYAAEDADVALRLYQLLYPQLQEQPELWELYQDVELPLNDVLVDLELSGILLDHELLKKQSVEVTQELKQLQEQIHQFAQRTFNIDSPKQLAQVLFQDLGLKTGKKTKTGYSTKQEVLESLSNAHPIINLLLRYRHLSKLKSTYLDALPNLIQSKTNRIHSSFKQTGTVTGRLSSSDPNLQNIPMRTKEGKKIREAFITQPGWSLISADYSQVELRLLAHFAQADSMITGFKKQLDIHASTAAEMYHCDLSEVSAEQRRSAKAINFGLMYGMGAYRLAENLQISRTEAKDMIMRYFKKYSEVQHYFQLAVEEARIQEYAVTLYGRKRSLSIINTAKGAQKKHAERLAINTPIQGTAADILKVAMVRLHKALQEHQLQARMLLTVHDELVLECPNEEVSQVIEILRNAMENACQLSVPLQVEIGVGNCWADIH